MFKVTSQINGHDINKTAADIVPLGSPVLSRRSWAHRGKESKLISPSYS
jgi:hypothetical protein